ncbi:SCO family protein [Pseudaestuariivita atlantica]|uniref:Protein senC n=1 Tax=Pseudaestuariivita atlantica TaxID=1317121 RepID=A0A0L1JPG0_9RHOB|nr:SCO family protein [Pseudaestuariivita atlantica]KNG93655.1 protein senC [Pseudaestuariivita atlantica]
MIRIAALVATLAIVALIGSLWYVTSREARDVFAACRSGVAGGDIGGPFTLVNGNGETVTDADVITEPTLIYFGYTFCPDVCPLDMARNAEAVDLLADEGIDATPVFITVDPARDTVDVVREFADVFHPRAIGLTGTPEQIDAAAKAYRVFYRAHDDGDEFYLVDHSVFTYVVLPGHGFVDFVRRDTSPRQLADRVACFANAA